MSSQKYWESECADDIDIEHSDDGGALTQDECEELFKEECRLWIQNNQSKLLGSPFATAYKKPWIKKTSPVDCSSTTTSENGSKTPSKDSRSGGMKKLHFA